MSVKQTSTIIAVTGTKGKTSVARALHYAVNAISISPVLRVDTNSVVLGNEKKFGLNHSRRNAGFVPTVCPGRFLILLEGQDEQTAVLEAAVGSSRVGLGYKSHNVGIFTNVYDDHVGMKEYLATREDLADAKASFIFGKIRRGGAAVFNADDPLVVSRLSHIPLERHITTIACTLREGGDPKGYDVVVSAREGEITLRVGSKEQMKIRIADYPWLLGGKHIPTLYNALSIIGALWGLYGQEPSVFSRVLDVLKSYEFDPNGGRLVSYRTPDGITVIVDFAHEKESLKYIAQYARTLAPAGKVYGVVRLDGARPLNHVRSTGTSIAPDYDEFFVYDKEASNGNESDGTVASEFTKSLSLAGTPATCYVTDKEALESAKAKAVRGDVVVYIISSFDKSGRTVRELFKSGEDV